MRNDEQYKNSRISLLNKFTKNAKKIVKYVRTTENVFWNTIAIKKDYVWKANEKAKRKIHALIIHNVWQKRNTFYKVNIFFGKIIIVKLLGNSLSIIFFKVITQETML